MNRHSDHPPEGAERARESAPDPPGTAAPPGGSGRSAERVSRPPASSREASAEAPAGGAASAPVSENAPEKSPVTEFTGGRNAGTRPGPQGDISPEQVREHLRRRAIFLRELAEARELRRRVTPHRSRRARIHAALRRRTFRIN